MKVIIPMSGYGERFRKAGYSMPKPLIPVDGKPIIAHVIDMFPGETDFIFICNREHLENPTYRMREILQHYCPTGKIVPIAPHKLGPVYAASKAFDYIDDKEPVIVNYCDFTCDWDYAHFKNWLKQTPCDGCVPAYRGFHPHSLGSTFYAYIRHHNMWMLDIQEKKPFTDIPMQEFASSGTYYFGSGAILKTYFNKTLEQQLQVNGEYYLSLVYKPMLADGLAVSVYELNHFMQWGTPQDLMEYQYLSTAFSALAQSRQKMPRIPGTVLIPMAGLGNRFKIAGYPLPKPLIPVSGLPMVVQATRDLPPMQHYKFVLRQDLPEIDKIQTALHTYFPNSTQQVLAELTDGQARTCLLAMNDIDPQAPLTIGACDNGVIYDETKFAKLIQDPDTDILVWVVRGHPNAQRAPQMYGWVATEEHSDAIKQISVKKPLENPATDPIVIGTFTFKRAADFTRAAERMISEKRTVNNEYYVDECINDALALGLKCRIFEVNHYLGWGTPDELRTFEYWQACFHYWPHHDYTLEKDSHVARKALQGIMHRHYPVRSTPPGEQPATITQ